MYVEAELARVSALQAVKRNYIGHQTACPLVVSITLSIVSNFNLA
jgi:hypothetical protein